MIGVFFAIFSDFCLVSTGLARAQNASVQTGPVVLSGAVADPDGAEIPGATLTLAAGVGKQYVVKSGSDGTYAFRGVPVGTYTLTITMAGFATYVRPGVKVGETGQTLTAKLAIQDQTTVVNVTADENHVSVDPDSSVGAVVLKGKDLDALSDDPDELSSELTALAGPSSGPNGGQIYIDGFTGGQLPPKSSIREIRINQNPFSAEYDQPGFGRIEVFTKPGTDKFRLYAQIQGNTRQFNTGSPFIPDNSAQPDYHQIFSFGQFSGPISKLASFTVGGSYRVNQNDSIVNPQALYATSATSGTICGPGAQVDCAVYTGYSFAQFVPQTRWDISPRVDVQITPKNTLTARFQYEHNSQQDQGIGGNTLPTVGTNGMSTELTVQLSDSQIVSDKVINETRFEYQRPTSETTPLSTAAAVSVQGAFTGGGSGGGASTDTQNHIEVQNYTSIALAKNFIRFGGRLRYTGETNSSTAGSAGTFVYSSICNYADTVAACTSPQGQQTTPPLAPVLSDFSITEYNANNLSGTVTSSIYDLGLYAETDWKVKPNWTFSYGLRFETQDKIHDKADWAPRLSTAYGVGKKTVLRAGFGLFYDRFGEGNELTTVRNNGLHQRSYTLSSSSASGIAAACSPNAAIGTDPNAPYGCAISASRLTVNTIAGDLRAPYRIQENLGVDRQLFKNATFSLNYQHIDGVHQFVSNVPNWNAPSTVNLDDEYESEGQFNQNQLIANFNIRNFHGASFGGFYSLDFANTDTGGIGSFASVPNDLHADYGRANFDTRNQFVFYGSFALPHLINLSPFVIARSGYAYNITSGLDPYGDNTFNARAVAVPAGTIPTGEEYVKTIPGCGTFATPGTDGNETPVPINSCVGPARASFNLRASKTWGFGPAIARIEGQGGPGGPDGPPGGGGRGGRGGGGRGGPGGGGPGGASSGKRYNLGLGVQIQNLFNEANLSTPVGTLSSPSFGQSTAISGFPFNGASSALRRVQFQATFNF